MFQAIYYDKKGKILEVKDLPINGMDDEIVTKKPKLVQPIGFGAKQEAAKEEDIQEAVNS
jgi:hypothetical protein